MKLSVVTALLAALPIISALTVETRAANIPRPYLRALKDCNRKRCKAAQKAWSECVTYTTTTRPSEAMQQCLCTGPGNLDGLWHYEWYSALAESCVPCVEGVVTPGDITLSNALGVATGKFCSGGALVEFENTAAELENHIFPFSLPSAVCKVCDQKPTSEVRDIGTRQHGLSTALEACYSSTSCNQARNLWTTCSKSTNPVDIWDCFCRIQGGHAGPGGGAYGAWGTSASDCSACINMAAGTHLDAFGLISSFCYIPTNYQTSVNQLLAGAKQKMTDHKSPIAMLSFVKA